MERDFLKPLMKLKQSMQVSTFKFANFETTNTNKFNISQLKANNFRKSSQQFVLSFFSMDKRKPT